MGEMFMRKYHIFIGLLFLFSVFSSANTASATVLYNQTCGTNCRDIAITYFPNDVSGAPSINFNSVLNKLGQRIKVHIYGSKDTYGVWPNDKFLGKFYANNSYKGKEVKTANVYLAGLLKDQKLINNVPTIPSYFTITNYSSDVTFCNYTISSMQNEKVYNLEGGSYRYTFHITWQNEIAGVSCNTQFIGGGSDKKGQRTATIHITLN